MLQPVVKYLHKLYLSITRSIAFIPSVITVVLILLALLALWIDESGYKINIYNVVPWISLRSASHASDVITTILGGTISLTVFSFSMVMVVLNQAAANYSPKLLGRLTEDRYNQFVLGIYIGTIIFCIILLVNFSKGKHENVPELAFFMDVLLGVINVVLFVLFINNIAVSIMPENIVYRVYIDTLAELNKTEAKAEQEQYFDAIDLVLDKYEWTQYYAHKSGYVQDVLPVMAKYLQEQDILIRMEVCYGEYVVKGTPLFSANRILQEEQEAAIRQHFLYYKEERVERNAFFGFRQLMEIAVKALSPGINNPGTAIMCIDYLADLLAMRMHTSADGYVHDKDGKLRLIVIPFTFEDVLYTCLHPIAHYGCQDATVLVALLSAMRKIAYCDMQYCTHRHVLNRHAKAIVEAAAQNINLGLEKQRINNTIQQLNNMEKNYYKLALIA